MTVALLHGHAPDVLRGLPAGWFHTCVTSPPYYGLRDYGIEPTDWPEVVYSPMPGVPPMTVPAMTACLGLEPTIEAFVGHTVSVFREVWRVLRGDGTLWLNIGDTYAGSRCGPDTDYYAGRSVVQTDAFVRFKRSIGGRWGGGDVAAPGVAAKNMMLIPQRLALALQADGWFARSDIIWHKPNAMPSSVADRPTPCHEYLWLLSKRPAYFYDAFAVKEPVTGGAHRRGKGTHPKAVLCGANSRMLQDRDPQHPAARKVRANESFSAAIRGTVSDRNRRTVWSIGVRGCKEAHFASFPFALVEPCVLAGTSAHGCCAWCGAPAARVLSERPRGRSWHDHADDLATGNNGTDGLCGGKFYADYLPAETLGWESTCRCGFPETVPCRVLDPFAGSGTVGEVAARLGRDATLIDINPDYLERIARPRVARAVEAAR